LFGDLSDQLLHLSKVRLLAAVGQDTCAELYDDAANVLEQLGTRAISFL
jgi:hypothetical protein